jgi:hypothetical protein
MVHALGAHTEPYRVFSDRAVRRALDAEGFRLVCTHRQFVLPIAFHKLMGSASATSHIESVLAGVGLRTLCGSPVTVVAERCTS